MYIKFFSFKWHTDAMCNYIQFVMVCATFDNHTNRCSCSQRAASV